MMRRKFAVTVVIVLVLVSSPFSQAVPAVQAQSELPQALPAEGKDFDKKSGQKTEAEELFLLSPDALAPSAFGYTLNDSIPYSWLDTSGGTIVSFPNQDSVTGYVDDDVAGPVELNFSLKFFEYTYQTIYISSNGLLSFGSGDRSYRNVDIPRDEMPNAFIAPFWDDLEVGGASTNSRVIFKRLASPGRFVVEWQNVNRRGASTGPYLTFQAVLYENSGNILFQYKTMDGVLDSATIGVEDTDGRDGLRYLYNQPGLGPSKAVLFERPPAAARVKTLPASGGRFSINQDAVFSMTVRNTGDLQADRFNLLVESSRPNWKVELLNSSNRTLLVDTNSDSFPDTGPLNPGASLQILVRVTPPAGAPVGEWTRATVTARSTIDASKSQSSFFQTAVPAPFAQAYTDEETGFRLGLFSRSSALHPRLEQDRWFSGNTLAVAATPGGDYIYAWQSGLRDNPSFTNLNQSVDYTDIEYMVIGRFGEIKRTFVKLTSNSSQTRPTHDNFPAVAVDPSGHVGIIWTRTVLNEVSKTNYNVYFAIVDQSGRIVLPATNITNNTKFRGKGDLNIPLYADTRISTTPDGRFVLAWSGRVTVSTNLSGEDIEKSDIWASMYQKNGSVVKSPALLTNAVPGTAYYKSPSVIGLKDNRSLIGYTLYNDAAQTDTIMIAALNSSGAIVIPERAVPGGSGWGVQGAQLKAEEGAQGKILLAWTQSGAGQIAFATLQSDTNLSLAAGPFTLAAPDNRQVDYISVVRDPFGNGVITWMDAVWSNHFYYALVDSSGQVKTPAMFFHSSPRPEIALITSDKGQGLAYYEGAYQAFLPLAMRH